MQTTRQAAEALAALARFEEAVIERAFKGTYDVSDHAAIEAEYVEARNALLDHLK